MSYLYGALLVFEELRVVTSSVTYVSLRACAPSRQVGTLRRFGVCRKFPAHELMVDIALSIFQSFISDTDEPSFYKGVSIDDDL